MTSPTYPKDLLVLAADSQMREAIEVLLNHRQISLGIGTFTAEVIRHPNSDPGCRTASQIILNPLRRDYHKALVVFDFKGCGENHLTAKVLEEILEQQYVGAGWGEDTVAFVVIDPELEAWVFGASLQQLQTLVQWSQPQSMRDWLQSREFLIPGAVKPQKPKDAFEEVLHQQKIPRSAKLYSDLARNVGLANCQDRAFQKFCNTLQRWFPAG